MRKLAVLLSVFTVLAVGAAVQAGPVFKVALTSSDAGSTNTGSIVQQRDYIIQCATPACFKTGSSTVLTATCSQDFVMNDLQTQTPSDGGGFTEGIQRNPQPAVAFKSGQDTKVVARALDGGNPACNVYLDRRY